nr:MAG TPA: hypothetical protein [Bacteriophage sp.]
MIPSFFGCLPRGWLKIPGGGVFSASTISCSISPPQNRPSSFLVSSLASSQIQQFYILRTHHQHQNRPLKSLSYCPIGASADVVKTPQISPGLASGKQRIIVK